MNVKESFNDNNNNGESFYQSLDEQDSWQEPIVIAKESQVIQKLLIPAQKLNPQKFIITDPVSKQYHTIYLTNYRVLIQKTPILSIPYGYIEQVKRLERLFRIVLKTGIYFDFYLENGHEELEKQISLSIAGPPFCFNSISDCEFPNIYDSYAEIQRMRVDSNNFSVFKNVPSKFCATYPVYLLIPKGIEVANLSEVRKCRWHSRIPVMSYYNEKNGVGIWRAAKRKPQMDAQVLKYDISYIRSIPGSSIILQIEENPLVKSNLSFQSLQNLKICFMTLIKQYSYSLQHTIGPKIQLFKSIGKWYEEIDKLISFAYHAVDFVNQGHHVLLEENYALDRVTQVLVLCQIIMDPFFRTFDGLSILIEKQFISYGHPFEQRCGFNKNKGSEVSPIFIQALQCINQLVVTHPSCFEYTPAYLARIGYEVYTTKYKNFQYKSGEPLKQSNYNKCKQSIWQLRRKKNYFNFQYEQKKNTKQLWEIRRKPSIKQYVLWSEYMDMICKMGNEEDWNQAHFNEIL